MTITQQEIDFDKLVRSGYLRACEELDRTPRHMLDEGNPNHPVHERLFGYDQSVFLAKQYKPAA